MSINLNLSYNDQHIILIQKICNYHSFFICFLLGGKSAFAGLFVIDACGILASLVELQDFHDNLLEKVW